MEGSADVETEKGRDGKWRVAGLCNNYLKHLRGSIQYKHDILYIYIYTIPGMHGLDSRRFGSP